MTIGRGGLFAPSEAPDRRALCCRVTSFGATYVCWCAVPTPHECRHATFRALRRRIGRADGGRSAGLVVDLLDLVEQLVAARLPERRGLDVDRVDLRLGPRLNQPVLDATPQISALVKLKLANCARRYASLPGVVVGGQL